MANEVNIYSPRYLAEVVRQTPAVHTYFRDTFFTNVKTFATERVDIDLVKGDRRMAAFVHPRVGGKVLKANGYQTESYKPPLINPYDVTTADQLMTRLPGEDLYSGMTPAQRAAQKLMEEYATLNDATTRREEWMAVQAIVTGTIPIVGEGVNETIDFGLTNKKTLTGDNKWGGTKADILGNLGDWTDAVLHGGFANVDTIIMGKTAKAKFFADANVQKMLDNRRMNLGEIAPRDLPNGVKYLGHLNDPSLDMYVYQSAGSVLRGAIGNSKTAQWLGGIGSSLGNLGGMFANSRAGQFAGGLMGKAGGALGKLTMPLRQGIAGIGAAATIQGSIFQQGLSGLLGKAGGVVSGIANSGAGKAVGSIFSGGAGLLGSIYGPIAGGLGSLLSGALPIVGVISGIIAVVSILTDKFGGLDKIIQRVFGDTGLEKFTAFKDALLGLFEDGGVAKALQPLQESITNLFGEDAGAAFGGITTILQSVMGVIGQLVTFSQTTVRPIIESLFGFITQTVVPVILQTITAAAPSIASIISGVGSVVMTVAQIIGEAIQFLMPIIQTVITVLLHIGQVVVPAVLAAIGVFAEGISSAINGVKTIFEGVINFITGVFSGNWRMAWEGVKSIFVGIFNTLGALFKTPINAVIALINKAIAGINSLGITIPDWVPLLGGKSFSINIPEIPMLAQGGFTNGASIAGEAGTEAVISFQRAARRDNLDIWAKAGQMLGVKPVELAEIDGGGSGGGGGMTFAPVINIQGNADRSMVEEALAEAQARFEAWYLQMQRRQARTAY